MTDEQKRIEEISSRIVELARDYAYGMTSTDGLANSDMQAIAEAIAMDAVKGGK